jgi:hypothetical protein
MKLKLLHQTSLKSSAHFASRQTGERDLPSYQLASPALVNVVSECGGMIVEDLPTELRNATARTDLTMMVLTRGYVDSNWCDDEMHARARSACTECPSHRLFPLRWRNYPWNELWSRKIEG